jgi:SulP family sulfate permease
MHWRLYVPKTITVLREGYGLARLRADLIAGLTVAIVALPLSLALAIASGATPERGLYTAIVAGFLISLLGGSRYQIGGPTGAFVAVVFTVIQTHGYDGLVLATLLAGVILIAFGLSGLGTIIKYIPYPVVTGFTSGIALLIFSSQVADLLGLRIADMPGDFLGRVGAIADHIGTFDPLTLATGLAAIVLIFVLRRLAPRWPGFLIAVILGGGAVALLGLEVETIGSRFGDLPRSLPAPVLPALSWSKLVAVVPAAFTIAFLAGIESLLSCVIADGMTGGRHRSNSELVAQGLANIVSVLFGGIPATGALARTATNIKAGGQTPFAGMIHAAALLAILFVAAPLARHIPLTVLAGVLVVVAWNMSEAERFLHLQRAPLGDRLVLVITFLLTVLVDITVAVEIGVLLAMFLFLRRMIDATVAVPQQRLLEDDADDFIRPPDPALLRDQVLPPGVEAFQINGPFFFGAAARLTELLDRLEKPPRVFILRLGRVPFVDASGAYALAEFVDRCERHGTQVILSGARRQVLKVLLRMGLIARIGRRHVVRNFERAVVLARPLAAEL